MTEINSVVDSIHSLQGIEGVSTTKTPYASGKPLQATDEVLPEATNKVSQTRDELITLKNELNKVAEMKFHQVKFEVSDEHASPILMVVDSRSGEVIRQIPEENAITLKEMIAEGLAIMSQKTGLLLETDI